MIVGAAVCPGSPLLVPGLAPGLFAAVPDLVESCLACVAWLADADRILLITSGPRERDRGVAATPSTVLHPPGTTVSSALLTDSQSRPHYRGRLNGGVPTAPGSCPVGDGDGHGHGVGVGVGVIVGSALLSQAGIIASTTAVDLGGLPGDGEVLHQVLGDPTDRVGLLVIAEGSANRGSESPGGDHVDAEAFDAALGAELAAGSPDALLAAVEAAQSRAAALLWTSGPAFAGLAELTLGAPPHRAGLLYDAAPFGVGYFAARWSWRG